MILLLFPSPTKFDLLQVSKQKSSTFVLNIFVTHYRKKLSHCIWRNNFRNINSGFQYIVPVYFLQFSWFVHATRWLRNNLLTLCSEGDVCTLTCIIANHGFESAIDENHPWVTDDDYNLSTKILFSSYSVRDLSSVLIHFSVSMDTVLRSWIRCVEKIIKN